MMLGGRNENPGLPAIVSLEVECFITELERIRSVHDETRSCLAHVDYEHHFDKGPLRSSADEGESSGCR